MYTYFAPHLHFCPTLDKTLASIAAKTQKICFLNGTVGQFSDKYGKNRKHDEKHFLIVTIYYDSRYCYAYAEI